MRLAGEQGPDAVVVREAARQAGVSPSAAYRHFSGQEGLLDAVRDQVLQGLLDRKTGAMGELPSGASPAERIVAAPDPFAVAVGLWSAVRGLSVLCTTGGLRELPESRKASLFETTLQAAVRGIGG